jgi:hypothetical protein
MKHYADRVLERYLLNELPGHQMKEITRALETDELLQKRLDELKHSNQEILNRYPAGTMVPQILDRVRMETAREQAAAPGKRSHWSRRLFIASPVLAAALLLILLLSPFTSDLPEDTRIKGQPGEPVLLVFRNTDGKIEQLRDGSMARAGDLLQLKYKVPEKTYAVIVSIDGSGTVTLHFPENRRGSTRTPANREVSLPSAYELDDAPRFERFFLLTSNEPLNVGAVIRAAEDLASVPGSARTGTIHLKNRTGRTGQTSILLNKGGQI